MMDVDNNKPNNPLIKSFPTQKIKQNMSQLSKDQKKLFRALFNYESKMVSLGNILPFNFQATSMPFCSKKISKRETSYICYDCLIHEGFLLCKNCFINGGHKDHRYLQAKEQGACDCGHKEAMKAQHFCKYHSGMEVLQIINEQIASKFNRLLTLLFEWGFQIQSSRSRSTQRSLLEPLAEYLLKLNRSSLYYIQLTTSFLFDHQNPDHIFDIFKATIRGKIDEVFLDLFFSMLGLQKFRAKMLIAFLKAYGTIASFQSSKYSKLYDQLISDSQLVYNIMSKTQIPFLPFQSGYNSKIYFQHLYLAATTLSLAAAAAFLKPMAQKKFIILPMLDKIMNKCEKNKNHIITVFAQNIQEQFHYYKLLMIIISTQSQSTLKFMLMNYYKMVLNYPFVQNKIILVPQRIFILLIFKLFNCDIQQINYHKLAYILEISTYKLSGFMAKLGLSAIKCLGQFAANLSTTTYFDNYLPIYTKQQSQIILVDYLTIKISAMGFKEQFFNIISKEYNNEVINLQKNSIDQQTKEFIRKWNNMIKILAQICLSPRTEIVLSSFIKQQINFEMSLRLLIESFKTNEDLPFKDLVSLKNLFFGGRIPTKIERFLSFDEKNKKITLQESLREELSEPLGIQFYVSLLKTNLNKVVKPLPISSNPKQFIKQSPKMLPFLLRISFLEQLVLEQFKVICGNQNDYIVLTQELVSLVRSLEIIISKRYLNRIIDHIMEEAEKQSNRNIDDSWDDINKIKVIDVDEIRKIIYQGDDNQQRNRESEDSLKNKKRQLLKLKRREKFKQITLNQELILSNYDQPVRNDSQQVCLICRQETNHNELCFFGKLKYTNLLFNLLNLKGNNLIFKSCFHSVHYSCFLKLTKIKDAIFCPLCKIACNTVFPIKCIANDNLLYKINTQMQVTMSLLKRAKAGQMILEGIKYFGYIILANMKFFVDLTQKQIRLCKIIYALMKDNYRALAEKSKDKVAFKQFYPHSPARKQHSFDYPTFIQLLLQIVTQSIQSEQIKSQKIAEPLIKLFDFMTKNQVRYVVQMLDRILSVSEEQTFLEIILEELTPYQKIYRLNTIFDMFDPPNTVNALVTLRNDILHECRENSKRIIHASVCIICKLVFCEQCDKPEKHSGKEHQGDCLFFNVYTGGLCYSNKQYQLHIRSLYINQLGKVWQPKHQTKDYKLDKQLYKQVLNCLKAGNLFYFITNKFDGLKGKNINDCI